MSKYPLSLAISLLLISPAAQASLRVDVNSASPSISEYATQAPVLAQSTYPAGYNGFSESYDAPSAGFGNAVTQSGRADAPLNALPRAGWAKDMPMSLAIRSVVPANFRVRENDLPLNASASWGGDLPWPVVLERLSEQGNFLAHIDWDRREVSLSPRRVPLPQKNYPQNNYSTRTVVETQASVVQRGSRSKDGGVAPQIIRQDTQISMSSQSGAWVLNPKMTLKENVEEWASRAGWRVVWEGADYPIIAPASFTGDFASPSGPLAKLIAAYETSDQPLVASLTTMDKVVYVKNKFYESQEVAPSSAAEIAGYGKIGSDN